MELPAERLTEALRLSAEWLDAESVEELAVEACASLGRLIPSDGVGWNEIEVDGRQLRAVVDPPDYFAVPLDALARLIHQNPIVEYVARTGDGSAHTFSDFLSAREYHRRELYYDVYRAHRVEDQLACVIDAGPPLIGVAFNRSARTFTGADRAVLDLVRPHLVAAHRAIRARAEARARLRAFEQGLAATGHGLAVLDQSGRVSDATPEAHRLILEWFGGDAPAEGTFLRDDARLRVRAVANGSRLLLLDERRLVPDPAHVRALGLTRREAEIVSLAARGLTNSQIAAQLFVSPRTVQKHLEHAFRKLRVHRRSEAARVLFGLDQPGGSSG